MRLRAYRKRIRAMRCNDPKKIEYWLPEFSLESEYSDDDLEDSEDEFDYEAMPAIHRFSLHEGNSRKRSVTLNAPIQKSKTSISELEDEELGT